MRPLPLTSTLFPYHDALPISPRGGDRARGDAPGRPADLLLAGDHRSGLPARVRAHRTGGQAVPPTGLHEDVLDDRSEEHTSELQSHSEIVCRLLLEKKKNIVT